MKTVSVVAAVIYKNGRILATQRGYGDQKGFWEFPGGKIESGETPEEALVREIKEELLLDIDVEEYITTVEYDYPKFHLSMKCYKCSIREGESPVLLEHESMKWLSIDEFYTVEWLLADLEVIDQILMKHDFEQFY